MIEFVKNAKKYGAIDIFMIVEKKKKVKRVILTDCWIICINPLEIDTISREKISKGQYLWDVSFGFIKNVDKSFKFPNVYSVLDKAEQNEKYKEGHFVEKFGVQILLKDNRMEKRQSYILKWGPKKAEEGVVDAVFVDYIKKNYPNVRFWGVEDKSPIKFTNPSGKIMGCVMPVKKKKG